jgi:hypothetical protein
VGAQIPPLLPGASTLQGWKPPRWGELGPFPLPPRVDALFSYSIEKSMLLTIAQQYFAVQPALFGSLLNWEHMVLHMLASTIMWYPETIKANETPLLSEKLRACFPKGINSHSTLVMWSRIIKSDFTVILGLVFRTQSNRENLT